MRRLDSIHRKTDQKMIFCKKLTPFLIQRIAVRLQCVGNRNIFGIIFLFQTNTFPEKIQPCQRRFPALERDRTGAFCKFQCPSDHVFQRGKAHNAIRGLAALFHFVRIKTILTTHVAQAGCGLHHHMNRRHQRYFSTIAFI